MIVIVIVLYMCCYAVSADWLVRGEGLWCCCGWLWLVVIGDANDETGIFLTPLV